LDLNELSFKISPKRQEKQAPARLPEPIQIWIIKTSGLYESGIEAPKDARKQENSCAPSSGITCSLVSGRDNSGLSAGLFGT